MKAVSQDSRNVLIVDSEPGVFSDLRRALDEDAYEIIGTTTAKEAKQVLSGDQQAIQAVLVDWILPDMTGFELLRWIKKQRKLRDVEVISESETLVSKDVGRGIFLAHNMLEISYVRPGNKVRVSVPVDW
jgi:DNA-binding NtrC family response regulator